MTDALVLGCKQFVQETIDELGAQIGTKFPKAHKVSAQDSKEKAHPTASTSTLAHNIDTELCQLANLRENIPQE